jgi:hypothetical protein
MAVSRVTREELVEQSVTDYLREQMFTVRQYPADRVELRDAFTEAEFFDGPLDKNYLAIGFNFDDGGTPAELGSDLIFRTYTIEVWVIATSAHEGRNLANAVRDSMESEGLVPLKDVAVAGAPIIDYLIVDPVRSQRQPVPNPKAWQEFLWIVSIPVVDEYHARLV